MQICFLEGIVLKKLIDKIDRFCILHPRFGIPRLMMFVVIGTLAVWLFSAMDTTGMFLNMLTFSPEMVFRHGQVWRMLTFIFIPEASGIWLVFWLYLYYFMGNALEDTWGSGKFTIYYFSGVILSMLYSTIVWLITGVSMGMTVHYINLSMYFAFATLYPDTQFYIFWFIPVKVKWLAAFMAVMFVLGIITYPFPMNLLPLIALLNYFVFCGQWLWDLVGRGKVQRQKNVVNFQKETRRIQREMKDKPYSRKCEICGRTDADHPELEFRFCSRCAGYHCYCIDHINNHVHHRE